MAEAKMKIDVDLTAIKFLSKGAIDVLAERRRQRAPKKDGGEGYDDAHDDEHDGGQLALAACCYAAPRALFLRDDSGNADEVYFGDPWPWGEVWDKRPRRSGWGALRFDWAKWLKRRRSLLIKAAALLIAEVDRLDRLTARAATEKRARADG